MSTDQPTDKPTQDAPIMDGALDASEKEKEAGREDQRKIDASSDEAKHAHNS